MKKYSEYIPLPPVQYLEVKEKPEYIPPVQGSGVGDKESSWVPSVYCRMVVS